MTDRSANLMAAMDAESIWLRIRLEIAKMILSAGLDLMQIGPHDCAYNETAEGDWINDATNFLAVPDHRAADLLSIADAVSAWRDHPCDTTVREMMTAIDAYRGGAMTDWIEHKGGDCPVDLTALVDVKTRGGEHYGPPRIFRKVRAKHFRWERVNSEPDIMFYRLHTAEKLSHEEALDLIRDACTVSILSYEEAIDAYFNARKLPRPD